MREIEIKAGERVKILHLMSRNLRARIEFEAHSVDGAAPRGIIEASHGNIVTGRKTASTPLQTLNTFEKPWNQHGFHIHVTPETDTLIRFRTRHIREVHIYGAMVVMTVLGLIGGVVVWFIKNG